MTCENCCEAMQFQYEVVERGTLFVLWACACGHKLLQRRPGAELGMRGPGAQGVPTQPITAPQLASPKVAAVKA